MRRGHHAATDSDWDDPRGSARPGRRHAPPDVQARWIVERLAWTDRPWVFWAGEEAAGPARPPGPPPSPPGAHWDAALVRADAVLAKRLAHQPAGAYAARLVAGAVGEGSGGDGEPRLSQLLRQSNPTVAELLPLRDAVAAASRALSDARRFPKAIPKLVGDAATWRRHKEDDLRAARAVIDAAGHRPRGREAGPGAAAEPSSLLLESLCLWVGPEGIRPSRLLSAADVAAAAQADEAEAVRGGGQPTGWREAANAFLGQKRFPPQPTDRTHSQWYRCGKALAGWPLDVLLHVARAVGGPEELAEQVRAAPELAGPAVAVVLRELLLAAGPTDAARPPASPGPAAASGGTEIGRAVDAVPALLKACNQLEAGSAPRSGGSVAAGREAFLVAAARAGCLVPAASAGAEGWADACCESRASDPSGFLAALASAGLLEVRVRAEAAALTAEQRASAFDAAGRHGAWLLDGVGAARREDGLPPAAQAKVRFLCAAVAAGLDADRVDWVLGCGLSSCVEAALSIRPERVRDLLDWVGRLVAPAGKGGASLSVVPRSLLAEWGLTGRSSAAWGYAFALLQPGMVGRYFDWARQIPRTVPQLAGGWEPTTFMHWLFDLALPPQFARALPGPAGAPAGPDACAPSPNPAGQVGSPPVGAKATFLSRHADRLLAAADALLGGPPPAEEADPAEAPRRRMDHWQRCAEIACEWAVLKLPDAPAAFDRLLSGFQPRGRRRPFDLYGGEPLRALLRVCDGRPERAAVLGAAKLDLSWEEAEQVARAWDCLAPVPEARRFISEMAGRPRSAVRAVRWLSRLGFCLRLQHERRLREKLQAVFAPAGSEGGKDRRAGEMGAGTEPAGALPGGPNVRSLPPDEDVPPEHAEALARLQHLRGDGTLPARVQEVLRRRDEFRAELRGLEARQPLPSTAGARADKLRRLLDDPQRLREGIGNDLRTALPEALDEARFKALERLVQDVTAGHVRKIIGTTPPQDAPAGTPEQAAGPTAAPAAPAADRSRNWDNAARLYFSVRRNRNALKRLMRHAARGDRGWLADFPPNRQFLDRVAARGVDAVAWLGPFGRIVPAPGGPWRIEVETDPLHVLRMGNYFGTCLAEGREYAYATIANAVEANKRVVYVRDERGDVIGRKLLVMTPRGQILGFRSYGMGPLDPWGESHAGPSPWMKVHLDAFCREWADACGATLHPFPQTGAGDIDPRSERGLTLFAHWYNDCPEPFDPAWLTHAPADLRREVAAGGAVRGALLRSLYEDSDEAAAKALRAVLWLGDDGVEVVRRLAEEAEAGKTPDLAARAAGAFRYIARHALSGKLRQLAEGRQGYARDVARSG